MMWPKFFFLNKFEKNKSRVRKTLERKPSGTSNRLLLLGFLCASFFLDLPQFLLTSAPSQPPAAPHPLTCGPLLPLLPFSSIPQSVFFRLPASLTDSSVVSWQPLAPSWEGLGGRSRAGVGWRSPWLSHLAASPGQLFKKSSWPGSHAQMS